MQTVTDTTYNGWKNYETWTIALIVDNDQEAYRRRREIVREQLDAAPDDPNVQNGIWTVDETARYRCADALKGWVEEELLPDLDETELPEVSRLLATQLISAAMSEVNWTEIAQNWIDAERE